MPKWWNHEQDEAEREAELLSGEKYREKLQVKWEREAEVNALKKDLHYQDVLYDGNYLF